MLRFLGNFLYFCVDSLLIKFKDFNKSKKVYLS